MAGGTFVHDPDNDWPGWLLFLSRTIQRDGDLTIRR
jgi:hypothetical protein